MLFLFFFFISLFFFKNMIYSWMAMEILTLFVVFLCCKNNNVKNIMKLFYYLMIHTLLSFILIFLIMFSYNFNIILLFLCAKLSSFPSMSWMPEVMPFFSMKNFFILFSLPKLYPMLYFFFLEIDNMALIKTISFISIFFSAFSSLFSNNFKNFFTYASISQLGFFFLILMVKVFMLLFFMMMYYMVLIFFFFFKMKKMNFLPMLCFLSYSSLPYSLPFYFKYMTILNISNGFFFFFIFIFYYLLVMVFLRYVWYYYSMKKKYSKFLLFFISFFLLFMPFFFFFYM